jgi:division protein CdvB (Snf7/Vps24/ESCRT-III family)
MDEKDKRIQELQRQIEKLNDKIEILQLVVENVKKNMTKIISICTEETEEKEKSR